MQNYSLPCTLLFNNTPNNLTIRSKTQNCNICTMGVAKLCVQHAVLSVFDFFKQKIAHLLQLSGQNPFSGHV